MTHHIEISLEGPVRLRRAKASACIRKTSPRSSPRSSRRPASSSTSPLACRTRAKGLPMRCAATTTLPACRTFLRACARLTPNAELQAIVADAEAIKARSSGRGLVDPIVDFAVGNSTTDYLVAAPAPAASLYSIPRAQGAPGGSAFDGWQGELLHPRTRTRRCVRPSWRSNDTETAVKVYLHANSAFACRRSRQCSGEDRSRHGIAPFRAFWRICRSRRAGQELAVLRRPACGDGFLYEEQVTVG